MQAHIIEPTEQRPRPVAPALSGAAVTTVGTFASGQSASGSFHVAAEGGLGSFADGVAVDRPSETA